MTARHFNIATQTQRLIPYLLCYGILQDTKYIKKESFHAFNFIDDNNLLPHPCFNNVPWLPLFFFSSNFSFRPCFNPPFAPFFYYAFTSLVHFFIPFICLQFLPFTLPLLLLASLHSLFHCFQPSKFPFFCPLLLLLCSSWARFFLSFLTYFPLSLLSYFLFSFLFFFLFLQVFKKNLNYCKNIYHKSMPVFVFSLWLQRVKRSGEPGNVQSSGLQLQSSSAAVLQLSDSSLLFNTPEPKA